MTCADLVVAGLDQLLTCGGPAPRTGPAMREVGLLEQAWIAGYQGKIVFIGPEKEFREKVKLEEGARVIDGRGLVGLPGLVDCHTHLPFAGNREKEFSLRLQGYTYQQLAAMGLGIQTTVRATREASREELKDLCRKRLQTMLLNGTTTVEAKSGYGLNLEDEIKQLEVVRELEAEQPVSLVPTFMGAHEIPPEYRAERRAYLELLINRVMPEVRRRRLAEFFDIFCEPTVFTLEETRELAEAALKLGFKLKIHSDEFVPIGGTELAVELGARSAEHLINITPGGVEKLSRSRTAAVLLPGVSFFLMMDKRAPARELLDRGAIVALASDFNPGSSHLLSMLFVLQLGVFTLRLTVEEAINACTINAAYAIDRQDRCGSLEPGKDFDLILCDLPSYLSLAYELGRNPVKTVIKAGRVVVEDSRLTR
ncbi:MAG: Imidazolonepropionase [Candidatus Saccharicenans subterraneus]|uniref:Imidazolonepropionase n=1 Tax=Candidatus Saccharicenans subterraneus TaxID=2508984 RepID=A0A3E2BLE3_9BACT|nr:MAG: Imidazolonepropionase [Candidatus Saccharicenans subterraneum]